MHNIEIVDNIDEIFFIVFWPITNKQPILQIYTTLLKKKEN